MKKIFIVTFLLIFTVLPTFSLADTFNIGIYENNPLVGLDEDGEADGFFIDILNYIAEQEGWTVNYTFNQLDTTLKCIENDEIDMGLGIAWSEERSEIYDYNKEAIFLNWGQVYSRQGILLESILDLEGKTIGVLVDDIHYIGEHGIKNLLESFGIAVTYQEFHSKVEILEELEAGNIDVCVINRTYGSRNAPQYNIRINPIQFNPIRMHIVTNKGKHAETLKVIDNYLFDLKNQPDSIYYESLNRNFSEKVKFELPRSTRDFIIFLAALSLVSIWAFIYSRRVIALKTNEIRQLNENLEIRVEERTLQLKDKQKELLESEKMASLGNLVGGISHEVNTPIGIAVTSVSHLELLNTKYQELLKNGDMTKLDLFDYMNRVDEVSIILKANIDRAAQLISSFKEIAVDRSIDMLVEINLKDYINKIVLSLHHEIKKTNHEIICDIPDKYIRTYPGAISQIFTNLIMNSLIHGFEEDESGIIKISIGFDDQSYYIVYSDNGKGIPKENINKIFDPFFTTSRGVGGSGLGLNIVYNLITSKLGGTIRCESSLGKGVEFDIKIPISEGEADE